MRIALRASFLLVFLLAATLVQAASSAYAAQANLADVPLPSDPKELLNLARKVNGLTGSDVRPWHLKASFEIFDLNGKAKDKGTFEEWWASDKQYKLTYTSAGFSQTEYGTDHGILHSGNDGWPAMPLRLLRSTLLKPFPANEDLDHYAQRSLQRKFGGAQFSCVGLRYEPKNGEVFFYKKNGEDLPAFCFDAQKPMLRYSSTGNQVSKTLYNQIVLFRGRYLAKDIQVFLSEKPLLTIYLDKVESLDASDRAALSPSSDAHPVTTVRVQSSSFGDSDRLSKKTMPEFPASAQASHLSGEVTLDVTIGKDGHVQNAQALVGPEVFQRAAINAVRQWIYKPYLVDGEAVEVDTQVTVPFGMDYP